MNEGSGDTLYDISGNGNDGTLVALDGWVGSQRDGFSVNFSGKGTNKEIQTGTRINSLIPGLVQGTIICTVYPNAAFNDSANYFFWAQTVGAGDDFSAQKYTNNDFYFGWNVSGDDRVIVSASAINWLRYQRNVCVFTWVKDGYSYLYHNGVEIGNNGGSTTIDTEPATDFLIGQVGIGAEPSWDGLISNFLIYDVEWTADVVAQHYQEPYAMFAALPRTLRHVLEGVK
jgi:hypothetical protein